MAIAVVALAAHLAVFVYAFRPESRNPGPPVDTDVFVTAEFIGREGASNRVPAPELDLQRVPIEFAPLREIDFDDSGEDELAEVTGATSAPHLARVQRVDPAAFARRARLPPGHAFTVLLRIEVREDGSVSSADLVRTSGDALADTAAIAYALELRWVPGTVSRSPTTMRVNFPVTLVALAPDRSVSPAYTPFLVAQSHLPTAGYQGSSGDE